MFVGLQGRYDHRFTRAETPTYTDLDRPRQSVLGTTFLSDQLNGRSLNNNNMRIGAFAFFDEVIFGGHFWLFVGGGASYQFINQFESKSNGCDVVITTGCATAQRLDNPLGTRVITDFGVGINYFPSAEWGIGLGYDNATGQLGEDGKWRNPFYSPDAQFSASVILSVDAIYERLQGNKREDPVIFFGSNKKNRKVPQPAQRELIF
jgi:hypothetical protein